MKRFFVFAILAVAALTAFAAQPRAEHPRPQFERSEWVNLNGEWTYELDLAETGFDRKLFNSVGFADKIIVPFAPESKLSGVEHKDIITGIWYHRTIQAPAAWSNRKIMLHFGAVYYEAEVYVDGHFVGRHHGGSSPFALDVTKYLADGKAHNLVVRANSDLRKKTQGSGKQSLRNYSYGCVYARTTGIWQTVWLEATDRYSLDHVQVITDIDNHQVIVTPRYYSTTASNTLTISIKDNGKLVAKEGDLIALHHGEADVLKEGTLGKPRHAQNILARFSVHIKADEGIAAGGGGHFLYRELVEQLAAGGCLAGLGLVCGKTRNKALKLFDLLFVSLVLLLDEALDKLAGFIPELIVTHVHLDAAEVDIHNARTNVI